MGGHGCVSVRADLRPSAAAHPPIRQDKLPHAAVSSAPMARLSVAGVGLLLLFTLTLVSDFHPDTITSSRESGLTGEELDVEMLLFHDFIVYLKIMLI